MTASIKIGRTWNKVEVEPFLRILRESTNEPCCQANSENNAITDQSRGKSHETKTEPRKCREELDRPAFRAETKRTRVRCDHSLVETALRNRLTGPVRHESCLQLLAITRSCCRKPRACIDMQNNGEIAASKTRAFVGPWTRLFMVRYAVITRHKSAKDGCNCLYRTWYETMPSPVRLLMWLCLSPVTESRSPRWRGNSSTDARDVVQNTCYGCFKNFWLT